MGILQRKVTWAAVPVLALGASASPLLAEESPDTASLAEVTVAASLARAGDRYLATELTALKGGADLLHTPQSVSVVTRQLIDDQGMRSLADVVRYVPGIGIAQGEGNREALVFRGSTSTADYLVDGLRDDVQYYRDLYTVSQVEALKGPNGLAFGRGGVGGVINRVTKQAGGDVAALSLQAGSWEAYRATADLGRGQEGMRPAWRVNGVWEDAGSYREGVSLRRQGVAPAFAYTLAAGLKLGLQAEYFHDARVADRGVSSYAGRPLDDDPSRFFGDPARSPTETTVRAAMASIEAALGASATLRNRTRYASYDKAYQNVYPGVVSADGTRVSISAYQHATQRRNLFNQTDLTARFDGTGIRHDVAAGIELGRQDTDNRRQTGYFVGLSPTTTAVWVPVSAPRTDAPLHFRASGTDANNLSRATTLAAYAQDRMQFGARWELVLGLRLERFDVDFTDRRTGGAKIRTQDVLASPGAALLFKPLETVSTYASVGASRQPRAGEQLGSLTTLNAALAPESFRNRELGAKWDIRPGLQASVAAYHLERRNVAITDPANATQLLLVNGQVVDGAEFGLSGHVGPGWQVTAAAAWQDGRLASNQSATLREGARLAALPAWTASLWNRVDLAPRWGAGLGLSWRDAMFAAVENRVAPSANVVLPGYARMDAALYYRGPQGFRAQLNVENLLDRRYDLSANSTTNITPGSPRSLRLSLSLDL